MLVCHPASATRAVTRSQTWAPITRRWLATEGKSTGRAVTENVAPKESWWTSAKWWVAMVAIAGKSYVTMYICLDQTLSSGLLSSFSTPQIVVYYGMISTCNDIQQQSRSTCSKLFDIINFSNHFFSIALL